MLRHRFFYVNMNKKSLNWGMGITVVWLAIIFIFWFFGDLKSPISLNELGDFLAGIFAPVAFLWLVLGYVQQGKQLEQNTKALEQQEQALQLQIDEMKESVKQQKRLVDDQQKYYNSLQESVKPILELTHPKIRLKPHFIDALDANIEYQEAPLFQFRVFNDGKEKACFIEILGGVDKLKLIRKLNRINDFQSVWIASYLTINEAKLLNKCNEIKYKILINFEDIYGNEFQLEHYFDIQIKSENKVLIINSESIPPIG